LSALRAWRRRLLCDAQVRPRGRYQRTCSVGQYQRQMQLAAAVAPAQHRERRSLKGMARTNDRHLVGIAIEMVAAVVGSLSSGPSGVSIMIGSSASSRIELVIHA
jgi:hypothetical protein